MLLGISKKQLKWPMGFLFFWYSKSSDAFCMRQNNLNYCPTKLSPYCPNGFVFFEGLGSTRVVVHLCMTTKLDLDPTMLLGLSPEQFEGPCPQTVGFMLPSLRRVVGHFL